MKRVRVAFTPDGWDEYTSWLFDKKIQRKLNALIGAIMREPFSGPGKPEPLKGWVRDTWSRRIDDTHRIVYRVTDTEIEILSCRGHYDDH